MDFTTICSSELEKLTEGKVCRYGNIMYYSLERIIKLIDIVKNVDQISDIAVIPYYFFGEQLMELYDYTLSIRVVSSVRKKELFFLEETGKKSIEEIDKNILDKLDITYHEVSFDNKTAFLSALTRYTNFMESVQGGLIEELRAEVNLNNESDSIYYQIL